MKVFLDDQRPPPAGWTLVRWPDEAIALLKSGAVTHISLDHDLGDDRRGTGYDCITWIERAVVEEDFSPPIITVHTGNSAARERMVAGVAAIQRLRKKKQEGGRP